ncbi:MAG TPA: hypothetical protein VGR35_03490 [Tepidisphaeraceae bacterium]|nr:hypothetical protein [Tepidisphaeraceae bacterium]
MAPAINCRRYLRGGVWQLRRRVLFAHDPQVIGASNRSAAVRL